ncbi:hypothetical protein CBS147339_5874 [Penicillium roqueforti]|nr:hypothetical protein CBS147355_1268 [Penicillium roqueforti]KAI2704968.1 hypothetical protein CBS147372_1271 [Penicillium roqueforti]KAI3074497.1 hypothetical protein CBS147339_5874 [Penicillium roqueforti]KAI3106750.1 hypothetical protein CBS147338_751 [Penicillium roqueforti]KAI3110471.1 hypothetical protein CBS147333_5014 [Penicillium roqueforti]
MPVKKPEPIRRFPPRFLGPLPRTPLPAPRSPYRISPKLPSDFERETPLSIAVSAGNDAVVILLLNHGAQLNDCVGEQTWTPPTHPAKQQLVQQEDVVVLRLAFSPRHAQQQPLSHPLQRLSQPVSQHPLARESTHPVSSAPRTINAARATALPTNADRQMIGGRLVARTMGLALSTNTAVMGISAPMGFVAGPDGSGSPMPTATVLGIN